MSIGKRIMNALVPQASTAKKAAPKIPDSWESAATVINHLQVNDKAVLLTISGDNFSPIEVDFKSNVFYTEGSLANLPEKPQNIKLFTKSIDPNNPPSPQAEWQPTDALFWRLGSLAFEEVQARWLIPGEAYVLNQWPNLTRITHSVDELRLISMLANGLLTIEQLAQVSQVGLDVSARTISKLSLLGILKSAPSLTNSSIAIPPMPVITAPVIIPEPLAADAIPEEPIKAAPAQPVHVALPIRRPTAKTVTPAPVKEPVKVIPEELLPVSVFGKPKPNFDDLNGALPPLDLNFYVPPEIFAPEPAPIKPVALEAVIPEKVEEPAPVQLPELVVEPIHTPEPEPIEEIALVEEYAPAPIDEPIEIEPELPEEPTGPQMVAHLYPAFDLNAPPPPLIVREPVVKDPSLRIVDSFNSIITSKQESAPDETIEEHPEKRGGLFGKLRNRLDKD